MGVAELLQMTPHDLFGPPMRKGDFGVELELEFHPNNLIPVVQDVWEAKPENSLRGNSVEFVFKQPAAKSVVYQRLYDLQQTFKRAKVTPLDSYRASTHIHYNVQRKPIIDVIGSLVVYTILEPIILRILGPMRDGNLFCLSSYDTGDLLIHMNGLAQFCLGRRGWPERGKYASWSLDPVRRFGSVECRIFPTGCDPDKIVKWCTWMENIFRITSECSDKTFITILNDAQNNANLFAQHMLDTKGLSIHARPNTVESLIHYGCEQSFELCRVLQTLLENKDETKIKPMKAKRRPPWQPDPDQEPEEEFIPMEEEDADEN